LISAFGSDEHAFISLFAKYVGVSPQDINWVVHPYPDHLRLFKEGKIDAFFATYPWLSELRKKKIGHALVNTASNLAHYQKPAEQRAECRVVEKPSMQPAKPEIY